MGLVVLTKRGQATSAALQIPSLTSKLRSMKLSCSLLGIHCALAAFQFVIAEELQLRPGQLLRAGAASLDLGDYAIPCVTDWNGDGRKDLVVGYRYVDKIALFMNTGSDASPAFSGFMNLQAGGIDIVHLSGGCGAPAPFVCDYDADGRRDLLVGEGLYGYVYFYRNTNTDTQPILTSGVQLMIGSSPLGVAARATPCVCDWDEDGLNDLVCGGGDGYVMFFRNVGSANAPVYSPGVRIRAGGTDVNLGFRSVPRFFDWDGDGARDLVGSSATGVYWCRNVGGDGVPNLQAPVTLRAPLAGSGLVAINTGTRMRLDLVDWNNDGSIDLLLGNTDGTITYFEGYRFAFGTCTLAPQNAPVLRWHSALYLGYDVFGGSATDAITNRLATNWPSGGNTTCWTNTAPTNPQFYRVQVAP